MRLPCVAWLSPRASGFINKWYTLLKVQLNLGMSCLGAGVIGSVNIEFWHGELFTMNLVLMVTHSGLSLLVLVHG